MALTPRSRNARYLWLIVGTTCAVALLLWSRGAGQNTAVKHRHDISSDRPFRARVQTSTGRTGDGPTSFQGAFERGVAAYNADDVETAVDAFEEAVRLNPSSSDARINLGLVYLRQRRLDDALRELTRGVELERTARGQALRDQAPRRDGTIERDGSEVGRPPR